MKREGREGAKVARRLVALGVLRPFAAFALKAVDVYSTVTDFARFRGWSTLHPRFTAM